MLPKKSKKSKIYNCCIILVMFFFCSVACYSSGHPRKAHSRGVKIADLSCLIAPANKTFWDKKAISELKQYYKKITGKELESIVGKSVKATGNIFIGKAALASKLWDKGSYEKITSDGFVVVSNGKNVAIYGKTSLGNLYGVYSFLNKIGMEIYSPDCVSIPSAKTELRRFKYIINPAFEHRVQSLNFGYYPKAYSLYDLISLGFSPENRTFHFSLFIAPHHVDKELFNHYKKLHGRIGNLQHTSGFLCPPYKYLDAHPEYYARSKDGKVFNTAKTRLNKVKLCYSNPEVFKIAKQRLLLWMEKTPQSKYYYVTDGDSKDWCECAECRKLDPPGVECFSNNFAMHMSDRILQFVNRLAREVREKYPDKILITFAYQSTIDPPQIVKKLEPNVMISICPSYMGGGKCQVHDLTCERNKYFLQAFNQWEKIANGQLEVFDYPMGYDDIYSPIFTHDAIDKKLKFYHKHGVKGINFCGQPYTFGKMFIYVQGKLLWNPNQDSNELGNRFLNAYYGAAAKYMQEFINLYRSRLYAEKNVVHQTMFDRACPMLNKDFAQKAYAIFARAEKSVPKNSPYYKRVKYEKLCGVLYADLNQYITVDEVDRYTLLKELAEICLMSDPDQVRRLNLKRNLKSWLAEKFQIKLSNFKVKTDVWYRTPEIQELVNSKNRKDIEKFIDKLNSNSAQKIANEKTGDSLFLSLFAFKVYGTQSRPQFIKRYSRYSILLAGGESMRTVFNLKEVPQGEVTLKLSGMDDDKSGKTPFILKINGKLVPHKANDFSEKDFSFMSLKIPGNYFKQGVNTFRLINTDVLLPMANWLMISKIELFPLKDSWKILKSWKYQNGEENDLVLYRKKGCMATRKIAADVKSYFNANTLCIKVIKSDQTNIGAIQLCYKYDKNMLKKGQKVNIAFWIKSNKNTPVRVSAIENKKPWKRLADNAFTEIQVTNRWKRINLQFEMKDNFKNTSLPRIFLGKARPNTIFHLSPVIVKTKCN
jgi:Domain of unknown function (DUF4838)/Glycosyl hydrolase family 67 N-terminus/Carbohydrate binding domain